MSLRRKDKEISDRSILLEILTGAAHITLAMCRNNEPYLVTLSHGYDSDRHCLYFHCAQKGKKIDILKRNNTVWGQALRDEGYVQGACDHLFATVHFRGEVTFVEDPAEKKHALRVMIKALDDNPEKVIREQVTDSAVAKVGIGRIDIQSLTGKRAERAIISL